MLGKSLKQSDNPKLALPYLQSAAELAPDDLEIRLAYGILLAEMELFEEAGKNSTLLLNKTKRMLMPIIISASCMQYRQTEKRMRFIHLEKAFTLEPEHTQARYIYDMIKLG